MIDQVPCTRRGQKIADAIIPRNWDEATPGSSSIAVHIPPEPIDWGGDPVSLVAMMAFSKDSREEFGELFESVIRVLSKPRNIELLAAHGGSYEDFISTLLDII